MWITTLHWVYENSVEDKDQVGFNERSKVPGCNFNSLHETVGGVVFLPWCLLHSIF